ncbi:MAG TPA: penicillin-binding transpeptidase domain-containing protein, partial [Candidatus Paceibacterota bacterium]|nr:penicillin-binding transpeptidase domain-containing protein [Candidatus Paceibacterota bacterium]
NPMIESDYEMGSIVKPLVIAAALDMGAVTPETTYIDNTGSVQVDDRVLNNFDKKGRGTASMQEVLNQSLNTGMVFVQRKMGKDAFRKYLLSYEIGDKTGIDLPGEVSGIVGNLQSPGNVEYATASFGQGIATTPIAIVKAYSALANNGVMVTPHLGKRIEQQGGGTKELTFKAGAQVITPETAATITNMLVKVVDKGYRRGLPNYTVAAKTGTAQVARPGGKGYYEDRNLHSLIGYFPASNPRFILYLFNYYPKGASFASETLSDPFFDTVQSLISYYELAPDR